MASSAVSQWAPQTGRVTAGPRRIEKARDRPCHTLGSSWRRDHGIVLRTAGGKMARGDQLSRQWRLIRFLDHPNGFTVDEAARELGCTVRTVWRDLAVLQKASFPLYDDKDGRRVRYRLVDGFRAKLPAPFTLSELVALLMSRDLLAPVSGSLLAPPVQAAFDKIRALLPRPALRLLDEMRTVIGVRALGAKLLLGAAADLAEIQQALLERRTLDLDYFAFSKQEETTRFVDPYHLTLHRGGLYLIGYCHTRKDLRIFAVERIRRLKVTDRRFAVPADFNPERFLESAWGLIRGQQVTVKVVLSPKKESGRARFHIMVLRTISSGALMWSPGRSACSKKSA